MYRIVNNLIKSLWIIVIIPILVTAQTTDIDFDFKTNKTIDITQVLENTDFQLPEPLIIDKISPSPSPTGGEDLQTLSAEELQSYLDDNEDFVLIEDIPDKSSATEPEPVNLGGDGKITLYHQWHKETLEVTYRDENGNYIPEGFAKIKHIFRCRLTGQEKDIPAKLIELIDAIQDKLGGKTVTIISGYRSPKLNQMLDAHSDRVAKNSYHIKGWASDITISGIKTSALRDIAKSFKDGGVGYYSESHFVHVDIGPIRYW